MPSRNIPVGHGCLLISYDKQGLLRDLYYPYVGMENHAQSHPFRIGVWVEESFSWLDNPAWERTLEYEEDTLVARLGFLNKAIDLELRLRDTVDFHENLFLREINIHNTAPRKREVRLFFHHDFNIYGTAIGDTACYKPVERALLHYKGRRYFLISGATPLGSGLAQYATGVKDANGLQGTWVDAEDGVLSGNPIAQGSVDSTTALHVVVQAGQRSRAHYWIAVGKAWNSVSELNKCVGERTPDAYIKRTADYWRFWVNKEQREFADLPVPVIRLYKRSLLILRTNIDNHGPIIAANDSDILLFNRDTYSYHWPRDGAIVAYALSTARYPIPARKFFEFSAEIISKEGCFLHKYNPNGSLASSWHPWVADGEAILPIQEDETGLILWALWEHFRIYRDLEFIHPLS